MLTLIFLSDPVHSNGQNCQKQKWYGTSDQLLFRLWNKFKNISLFAVYYLTNFDDIMWSSFWFIPKIASANLCKSIDDIINYPTSICPFKAENCGKEGKKLQKFEYLKNKKIFLDEIKNLFYSFSKAIIWWKNKNLIKNSGHKL